MTTPTVIIAGSQILRESTFQEVDTPSTPGTGKDKLYFKEDGKLYKLNSSGVEAEVGSGTGSSHDPVTIDGDSPLALSGQAISMENEDGDPVTKISTGELADSDTEIPSSKAVKGEILGNTNRPVFLESKSYGTTYSFLCMNNKGDILAGGEDKQTVYIIRPNGTIEDLGKFHDTKVFHSGGYGINDKGTIFVSLNTSESTDYHDRILYIRKADGTVTTVDYALGYGMNSKGQVVGNIDDNDAFVYTPGTGVVKHLKGDYEYVSLYGISEDGVAYGYLQDDTNWYYHLLKVDAAGVETIITTVGDEAYPYIYPYAVSNNGSAFIVTEDDYGNTKFYLKTPDETAVLLMEYLEGNYVYPVDARFNSLGELIFCMEGPSGTVLDMYMVSNDGVTVTNLDELYGYMSYGIDNNRNILAYKTGVGYVIKSGVKYFIPPASATEDGLMSKEDYALLHTAEGDDVGLTGTPKVFVIYDGETPYYFKAYPTKGA